jgi:eukaryotic-like serine/threonine-protein kinase
MIQVDKILNDRYQILNTLGQGGVATTYRAKDLETDTEVAIKVMSLRRSRDWKAIELFEREAKILAQLKHPQIPTYLDYFQIDSETDREFYIVQSLAPGMPLSVLIDRGWQPDVAEVEDIATQILEILRYLHHLTPPVIHRDIKPQNIIKSSDGRISLVDFGAVQDTYHQTVTGGSTVVGTYGYMAPEQFRGQAFLSTDLYGLAATLLFLLTRDDPSKLPQKQLKIDFRSSLQLPSKFADWIDRMLEPTVEQRFTSASEALAVLQGVQQLPPRVSSNRPRKPNDSPIRLIADDTELNLMIPTVKFRTTSSQQLGLLTITLNFILVVAIYFIAGLFTSLSIDPIRLQWFGPLLLGYAIVSLGLAAYTIFGNFSRIKIEVISNRIHFRRFLFNRTVVPLFLELGNTHAEIDRRKPTFFIFDRHCVRIKSYRDSYVLALLLTPAENEWLASELNLFIDRAVRLQQHR